MRFSRGIRSVLVRAGVIALCLMTVRLTVQLKADGPTSPFVRLDLGSFGGDYGSTNALNDSGEVVGWSEGLDNELHAFSWTATSGMTNMGVEGSQSLAYAVNAAGQ